VTLGARLLKSVVSVNSFGYATQVEASSGDAFTAYFQLIDKDQHKNIEGVFPEGLRYMPLTGASVLVDVNSIDDAKKFTRSATQPFAQDPSIWALSFMAADPLAGTVGLKIRLNESGVIRTVFLQAALRINGTLEIC
jgi:hypothetical protein